MIFTKTKPITRFISISAAAVCMITGLHLSPMSSNEAVAADLMTSFEITENMKVGWNLGNTLDAVGDEKHQGLDTETSWGQPKATKELITAVKERGFNTIRIPTTWYPHLDENNNIDEAWMNRVQEVVDYAYSQDMYVILNIHHEEWINRADFATAYDEMSTKLKAIWTQVAERFKDYDQHLIFEAMNEPRAMGTEYEWYGQAPAAEYENINKLNQDFLSIIRSTASPYKDTRLCMITPYCASPDENRCSYLDVPTDDKYVAVSIHAYAPYNFTMDAGTTGYHDTFTEAFDTSLDYTFGTVQKYFTDKDIPVIIGEFGSSHFDNADARADWGRAYISKTKALGIPCCIWDNDALSNPDTSERHGYISRSDLHWYEESAPCLNAIFDVLEDDSIVWGSKRKLPTYEHDDIDSGTNLYKGSGMTADASIPKGNCTDNLDFSLSTAKGKDIAVKFTGDAPVAAFMDADWQGWTEIKPYQIDEENGIAYYSVSTLEKSWTSNGEPVHICFRTDGVTTVTQVALINECTERPDEQPEFPSKAYDLDIPAEMIGNHMYALVVELEGDPNTDANGGISFMSNGEWDYVKWEKVLNENGKAAVEFNLGKIPEDATDLKFNIWWAAVDGDFSDIAMVDYKTYKYGLGDIEPTEQPETIAPTENETQAPDDDVVYGDADCDGDVSINDVTAILIHTANPNASKLSADGLNNADVYNRGDGVNSLDATSVQKRLASLITQLPETIMAS